MVDERALVGHARAGSQGAFTALFDAYYGPIVGYLYHLVRDRETADDLAQETFLRAYRALGRTDPDLAFRPWLYRIATNTARNHLRRQRLLRWLPLGLGSTESVASPGPGEQIARHEVIVETLRRIGPSYASALLLHHHQALSLRETAAALAKPSSRCMPPWRATSHDRDDVVLRRIPMNCSQARRLLSDGHNRPLEAPRSAVAAALSIHLRACADCARFDRLLREGLDGLRALPAVVPDARHRSARRAQFDQPQAAGWRAAWGSAWAPAALVLLTVVAMATAALLRPDLGGPAGLPPRPVLLTLQPDEAVDLARFRGYHTKVGDISGVPGATAAYVLDLPITQANLMIAGDPAASVPPSPSSSAVAVYAQTRVLFVVVHGTVMEGTIPLGEGLAMMFGYDGKLIDIAVGAPWDTAVPPGARAMPLHDRPKYDDVSVARAQQEFSTPLFHLARVPDGLALTRIDLHKAGEPVNSSPFRVTFDALSVTLVYTDATGRPRLWLTQAFTNAAFTSPASIAPGPPDNQVYSIDAYGLQTLGIAWNYAEKRLWLSADLSPDLTLAMIAQPGIPLPSPSPSP